MIYPTKIYMCNIKHKNGTKVEREPLFAATKEAVIHYNNTLKRLGFRLSIKLVNLDW